MHRRTVLTGLLTSSILMPGFQNSAAAQTLAAQSFDSALAAIPIEELQAGRDQRERQLEEVFARASGRAPLSDRPIGERAEKLIIAFEVSSPEIYEKRYRRPIRPGGASGITIGCGYDVGYVTAAWLNEDWKGFISEEHINTLEPACQVTGTEAESLKPSVQSVEIPWSKAHEQWKTRVLKRYVSETLSALPNAKMLKPDSLGALVSLVYNRGAGGFSKSGERFKEMRAIKHHIADEEFDRVPAEFRRMKRIWEGQSDMKGLLRRRDLEASLFELGRQV